METVKTIHIEKTINIPIKVWLDKDYVYCNSAEAVKYLWGSTTASCDMRRQGLERITGKWGRLEHYRIPRSKLDQRLLDLELKQERVSNAITVIKKVLKEAKK